MQKHHKDFLTVEQMAAEFLRYTFLTHPKSLKYGPKTKRNQ